MEGIRPPKILNLTNNIAEEWRRFRQNFEIFLKAGNHSTKESEVQVAILLNCLGEEAVELFNTFELTDAQRKNFEDVITAFEDYANPRRNVVVERYVFNCRVQEQNEKFDEFLTELKKLIKHCEYGPLLDSILRDRILLGISDKQIQERLLRESELTLKKTIEICRAAEISKMQSEVIQRKTEVYALNKQTVAPSSAQSAKPKQMFHHPRNNTAAKKIISSAENQIYLCKKCNRRHGKASCPAFGKVCVFCKGFNHFAVGCIKRNKNSDHKIKNFAVNAISDTVFVDSVYNNENRKDSWIHKIQVGKKTIDFKLDTGSGVNILPINIFKSLNCNSVIKSTNLILEAYGGSQIKPLGVIDLECKLGNTKKCLEFVLVDCNRNSGAILGLSSCKELGLIKRQEIHNVEIRDKNSFISENKDVFEGLGKFNVSCLIKVDENAEPIARPPRRVPEVIKIKLKDKLNELESTGIISKVQNPDGWISNLVIVEKPDGSIRVCLDPQDLNKVIKKEHYLIPTVDELIPKLCNKSVYSVFDLKDGFYQIELDESSSNLCQFSTPFGIVYKFNRLPFGISVAPQLFQKFNEKNFGDIPGVLIYFDDMLIYANNEKEHDIILNKVIERARKLNVKFNKNKLQFRVNEVKYLGHIFNKDGMKPDPEQVKAILALQNPSNKKELLRILGMINYLRNFIPNMSETTAPLRELLKTSVQFDWLPTHAQALNELKNKISKAPVLANFDSNKQIVLQCDSSKSGLGCCLLQDGKPVGFASRALSDAEQNYAQIEKEYLSIVFATKKFHNFIYGRKVTVQTDHKPLVSIHNKNVVNVLSSRLQRIKLKLLKYDLEIIYVPGKHMYVADLLSRDYINETDDDQFVKEIIHCVKATRHLQVSDKKLKQFKESTIRDPVLNNIMLLCKNGWPPEKKDVPENVRFYFKLRQDLFEEDGIIFLNNKIVVPRDLRREMLNKIHEGHFGMEKCKSRARQIFYWPGILDDIENLVAKCSVCEKFRSKNCKEPLISHNILSLPFEKVGCDICEFGKENYLVLVDYLTKWLEIVPIVNKQASEIVKNLKVIFSVHGIPRFIVADNMPFNSKEFRNFASDWDFEIINSSPRYPKSNGQAESGVKIAKNILKKCYDSSQDMYAALMEYRNTPIKGLDMSPAQALMSKRNRTKIPINRELLKPEIQTNVRDKVVNKQKVSKLYYDKSAKPLNELSDGDNVLIRSGNIWERGKVIQKDKMPRSYWVKNENNRIVRRNRVHLRKSINQPNFKSDIEMSDSVGNSDVKCSSSVHSKPHNNSQHYTTRFGRTVRPPERYGVKAS